MTLKKAAFIFDGNPFQKQRELSLLRRFGASLSSSPPACSAFLIQEGVTWPENICVVFFFCLFVPLQLQMNRRCGPVRPQPPPSRRLFSIVCSNKALESVHLLMTELEKGHERPLCYTLCLLKEISL